MSTQPQLDTINATTGCDHLPSDPCVTECSTEPQGIHACFECGQRFIKATDWMDHTVPSCPSTRRPDLVTRAKNQRAQELRDALDAVLEADGWDMAVEIFVEEHQRQQERARKQHRLVDADEWRAREAAISTKPDYGI